MNALTNANTAAPAHGVGLTSSAFPEAKSSQKGVSVEYVPSPDRQWYVFRATYSREQQAVDILVEQGIYAYLAMGWKLEFRGGKRHRVLRPLLNLVFAYVTRDEAYTLVRDTPNLSHYLTFYYDHFNIAEDYRNPPLTVDERSMYSFIRATAILNEHVMAVSAEQCHFASNEEVRVIYGPFAGVVGRVVRVARQQRVAITIRGINALIVTAYIPSPFLEKVHP